MTDVSIVQVLMNHLPATSQYEVPLENPGFILVAMNNK